MAVLSAAVLKVTDPVAAIASLPCNDMHHHESSPFRSDGMTLNCDVCGLIML